MCYAARNGGHLTALPRLQYRDLRDKYGSVEARREVMLEDRVCSLVIEQIQRKGWQERVDLVQGGNVSLASFLRLVREVHGSTELMNVALAFVYIRFICFEMSGKCKRSELK